jgi:hypothetical protein
VGLIRNAHRIFVQNRERKRLLRGHNHKKDDNILMDQKEIMCDYVH